MRSLVQVSLFAAGLVVAGSAHAASFNCAKAATPDEKAVCGDLLLSDLDSRLGKDYTALKKKSDLASAVKDISRSFLADRASCGSDKACILSTYLAVLDQYKALGAPVGRPAGVTAMTIAGGDARATGKLPQKIGQCVATEIDAVHPRLGDGGPIKDEDYDSGTGVEYKNGGYGVSYDRIPALIHSKPGDPVVMCLVSVPHDCPPGDDRGRFYIGTNKRTGDSWILPDSQHMCGGA
ncbi:lysozyme inhibitor LprI family protein [Jiella sp. M17.18]|uniref:lysozyme inhibitor LprI family protein n=1 Tax=Jiella sp. M17.18 TaxID=3234247 RepID=UPI0034DFC4C3